MNDSPSLMKCNALILWKELEEKLRIESVARERQRLEAERQEKINSQLEACYGELGDEKQLLEILKQKQINFKNRLVELENKSRTEGEKMKKFALESLTKMEFEIFDNKSENVDSSFVNQIMQFKQNEKEELLTLSEKEQVVLEQMEEKEKKIENIKRQISNLRSESETVFETWKGCIILL